PPGSGSSGWAMLAFAEVGFDVIGLDVSAEKVAQLNGGISYIPDIPTEHLAPLVKAGNLRATTRYDALRSVDALSICVATPLRKTKDPCMSSGINSAHAISEICHAGMLVVLESTTYPGTTDEILLPRLTRNGLKAGQDMFMAFSPERIDPGNKKFTVRNTPK